MPGETRMIKYASTCLIVKQVIPNVNQMFIHKKELHQVAIWLYTTQGEQEVIQQTVVKAL